MGACSSRLIYLKGSIDDRNENVLNSILQNVTGKLYADEGYISKKLKVFLLIEFCRTQVNKSSKFVS
jgi:hypothetical protein